MLWGARSPAARGAGRGVVLKSARELDLMREAGRVTARALAAAYAAIEPGATTADVDAAAAEVLRAHGARPAFLGYGEPPFPAVTTVSVNEELVHGIPGERVLQEGDIVSIDLGVTYRGYVSDAAFTAGVGTVSADAAALMDATRRALWAGIEATRVGNRLGDVSAAIGAVAEGKYGIVTGYGGHGVGRKMHMEPHIPNYGRPGTGLRLMAGMVFALEPMFSIGDPATEETDDEWTVVMSDGSLSAHFEETVAITADGPEVLTRLD